MTPDELKALREKHGKCSCGYCDSNECSAGCVGDYPCDVIKVLVALEEANFQAAINYERGYDDGFKGSVADAEWDHWADGVSDD